MPTPPPTSEQNRTARARRPSPGTLRVAIAAGGTGGHVMPALALAQALSNIGRPVEVDFICGNRPVELSIYAQAGVHPRVFPVGSLQTGSALARAAQYAGLVRTFARSLFAARKYDVAVGMGGYVTAPFLAAAWIARTPLVLHDSNTVLGRVNRLLAPRARRIACGLPLLELPPGLSPQRIVQTGTPVRLFIAKGDPAEAESAFYLRREGFTLLVTGGSQGARGLNQFIVRVLGLLSAGWTLPRPLQVLWSTGEAHFEAVRDALRGQALRGQFYVAPSIERMDLAYCLTDLAITRAGGSSIAELLLCGIPSILFPLPRSAEDHQKHNAFVMQRGGASLVFDENAADPRETAQSILGLAADPARLEGMSRAAVRMGAPDAARDLARLVVEAAVENR